MDNIIEHNYRYGNDEEEPDVRLQFVGTIENNKLIGARSIEMVSGASTAQLVETAAPGSPEGVYSATPGSTYRRTDGGPGETFYVKEFGDGNQLGRQVGDVETWAGGAPVAARPTCDVEEAMNTRELLERLVAFPTVSRDTNLPLIEFVQGFLSQHGIAANLVLNEDGTKANLYATIGPNKPGGVILSGHTDVVPVDGQTWQTDPFTLTERNGRLYGRCTCDMKAFIATALSLVPEMRTLSRPIHLALSYDEEVGCLGAPHMIEQLKTQLPTPRAVIVGEPTELKPVTTHKGLVAHHTTVLGHEAHSSQTHRGVSAVMTAARLITFLDDMGRSLQAQASDTGFDPPWSTVHVGTVEGGTAINIISRHCEFTWEMRTIPDDDPQDLLDRFRDFYEQQVLPGMHDVDPDTRIDTTTMAHIPALCDEADNAAVSLVQDLLARQPRPRRRS